MKQRNRAGPMIDVLQDWLAELFPRPIALMFLAFIIITALLALWP